ncbi:SDR family NAD(P)-dependent oxidoreductase [Marisediminicola sp. LYQ134]|uniref:SDR family NAD(P)-dependent oxidoreductase n=1 Tax=Marisediminicola sp. LYQ134 TaxID=3391061 RepID=UPI003983A85C
MNWTPSRLPDQTGRRFVITGGTAGLGYFAGEQLARAGATIVIAARNEGRADVAKAAIRARVADARLEYLPVDLSSLESARAAGDRIAEFDRVDGLILNAGTTTGARDRQTSVDGHELTMATNYIGHFALTARAFPALERTPESRIVGLGSLATLIVPLDPADLQSEHRFGFFRAYGFTKHAVHGFILELDRRLRASGTDVSAVLSHPGYAIDSLTATRGGIVEGGGAGMLLAFGAQGKNRGAAPVVRAATDPAAVSGDFFGPEYLTKGLPVAVTPVASSASPDFGRELWRLSEQWTGERFRP